MSEQDKQAGLARRTQVMGEAFATRAMSDRDGFSRPLQDWLNEHAWGSTWQRDGIDLKTRSLVTVSMLTALGRAHELRGHVRGALNNGATPEELREVFLHATVYSGFPLAIDAFRNACEVIAEWKAANPPANDSASETPNDAANATRP